MALRILAVASALLTVVVVVVVWQQQQQQRQPSTNEELGDDEWLLDDHQGETGGIDVGEAATPPLYSIDLMDPRNRTINLGSLIEGKVALFVNIDVVDAHTEREIEALNQLYKKYRSHGFEIIAFPTTEFSNTMAKSDLDMFRHFRGRLKAKFVITASTQVNGEDAHQVFRVLKQYLPGPVQRNFAGKFLVNRQGRPVRRTKGSPMHLANDIEQLLGFRDEL